jgi:hypothetical protein
MKLISFVCHCMKADDGILSESAVNVFCRENSKCGKFLYGGKFLSCGTIEWREFRTESNLSELDLGAR